MKRFALALTLTALAIPLLGPTSSAEARDRHGHKYDRHRYDDGHKYDRGRGSWHAQTSFRVGDFNFSLGYHKPSKRGSYYQVPRYYYRTPSPISYRGYQCDSACYKHSDHYYHTPSCPLVRQHFRVFRYVPPALPYYFSPYGAEVYYYPPPYYGGYRYRGYRRGW